MTRKDITLIARALARLKGQNGIDEFTRRECVDEIRIAVQGNSRALDGGFQNLSLSEFRVLAGVAEPMHKKEGEA